MKHSALVNLALIALLLASSCAAPMVDDASPDIGLFDIHADKWMSLHHFAYHAARSLTPDPPRGLVALDPDDRALLSNEVGTRFAPLAAAYAPYVRESILHSTETRSIAKALQQGPNQIEDAALQAALKDFMPVYEAYFWPQHRQWAAEMSVSLSAQLDRYGPQMVSRLTTYLEQDWPDVPVRVDIVPYANWAGAYTDDNPPHITLSSNDPAIAKHAFEMVFHEASHTDPLARSIDAAADEALHAAGLESDRFWHYLLFFVSGQAALEVLGDPEYIPYAQATGLASHPAAAPFYDALASVWDSEYSLVGRATAAAMLVANSLAPERRTGTD